MWWAGSKVLDAYVGTRAVALCDSAAVLLAEPTDGFEASLSRVQGQLAQLGGKSRLRVWLSGGLCRPFLLPDLPGLIGIGETLRVATRLASERTGLLGDCAVWLDGSHRGKPRVAIAVAKETLDRLHAGLGDRRRLDAIAPWWSDVLRVTLGNGAGTLALGVQDCDSLTVLAGRGGGIEVATTVSPVLDVASGDSAFARALMSADVEQGRETLGRLVFPRAIGPGSSGCALGPLLEFRQ